MTIAGCGHFMMMSGAVPLIRGDSNVVSSAETLGLSRTSDGEAGDASNPGQQQDMKLSVFAAPVSSNGAMETGCCESFRSRACDLPAPHSITLAVPRVDDPSGALVAKCGPMPDDSRSLVCYEVPMQNSFHNAPAQPESFAAPHQDTAPEGADELSAPSSPELSVVSIPIVSTAAEVSQLRLAYHLTLRRLCMEGSSPQSMYNTDSQPRFPLNSNGTSPQPRAIGVLALPADPRFREVKPATSSSDCVPSNPSSPRHVLPDPSIIVPSSSENSAAKAFPGQVCSHPILPTPVKLRPGPPGVRLRFPLGLQGCSYSVIQPIPVSPLTSDALLISTHRQSDASPGASPGPPNQYSSRASSLDINCRDPSTPILLDEGLACTGAHNGRGLQSSHSQHQRSARHHPPSESIFLPNCSDREMAGTSTPIGYQLHSHGSPPVVLPDNRRISPSYMPAEKRPRYERFRDNRGYGPRPILPRPQYSGSVPGQSVGPHLIATIQTLEAQLQHADTELQRLKAVEEQYVRASSQRTVHKPSHADFMLDTADVVLLGSDESRLYAHKTVLVGKSQVFKARFNHPNEEKVREVVQTNFPRHILEAFVTFFYTSTVDSRILEMYSAPLLCAAETYSMEHLKSICEEAIIRGISQDNLLEMFELACASRSAILKDAVLDAVAPRGMAGICNLGKYDVYAANKPQLLLELYKVLGSYGSSGAMGPRTD